MNSVSHSENSSTDNMFRPPVNRAMQVLDRSFFKKRVSIGAAQIQDRKKISKIRSHLSKDILGLERMQMIRDVTEPNGRTGKALLLRPDIKHQGERFLKLCLTSWLMCKDPSTWSPILAQLVEAGEIKMMPFELDLDYDYWDYRMYVLVTPGDGVNINHDR